MKHWRGLILAVVLSVAAVSLQGCIVIEDGTVGVKKVLGKLEKEPLGAGLHLYIPFIYDIEVWDIKTQKRQQQLDIPSKEGLIVRLETSILFRPTDAVSVRRSIGVNFVQRFLDPQLTDTFREVIGKKRVEEVIQDPAKLTAEAKELLIEKIKGRGILVEDLLVTDLVLPQKFKESIERKLQAEQKALQKSFELDQAKKDAEIEIARAKGAAQAQAIVRKTLSPEYLQYLWISTLNKNPNVIYVSTEANMPMFRTEFRGKKLNAAKVNN